MFACPFTGKELAADSAINNLNMFTFQKVKTCNTSVSIKKVLYS
jgi:hypothetical protein